MPPNETEHRLTELRQLSADLRDHVRAAAPAIGAINACLTKLANLNPQWEVVLVAELLLLHHGERRSPNRRLLSTAIRLPGGVAVGLINDDAAADINDLHRLGNEVRFLPFAETPEAIQQVLLPLIPHAVDAFCDLLEARL